MREFIQDWKTWGFKTARYNLVFRVAYRLLGAVRMSVELPEDREAKGA